MQAGLDVSPLPCQQQYCEGEAQVYRKQSFVASAFMKELTFLPVPQKKAIYLFIFSSIPFSRVCRWQGSGFCDVLCVCP